MTINELKNLVKQIIKEQQNLLKEEKINDFFEFLSKNPAKTSGAAVYYTAPAPMNKNILDTDGNKKPNPMYGKLFKNTMILFRYGDTYKRAVERSGVDHEFQKRRGDFEKVEGFDVLETGKNGLYLPVLPTGSNYNFSVRDENGNWTPIEKEEAKKYLAPYNNNSANKTQFRVLLVSNIAKISAGGNTWNNPDFQYEYLGPGKI